MNAIKIPKGGDVGARTGHSGAESGKASPYRPSAVAPAKYHSYKPRTFQKAVVETGTS